MLCIFRAIAKLSPITMFVKDFSILTIDYLPLAQDHFKSIPELFDFYLFSFIIEFSWLLAASYPTIYFM